MVVELNLSIFVFFFEFIRPFLFDAFFYVGGWSFGYGVGGFWLVLFEWGVLLLEYLIVKVNMLFVDNGLSAVRFNFLVLLL